ncbi:MAG: type IV toxin-antitoxin system AbiEi family antitoxin [Gammaproteobacteria bacterium]|nr:type IV toxin-antitoxin system AbiEi family antitoxin [Gammaproteobacteria bacterium]
MRVLTQDTMKAQEFINDLRSQGRYFFTIKEAEKALALTKIATINAIRRLRLNKSVVSPARGFYLILPPEYQVLGCLPADMFIPDLMKYLNQPYYVGFLSAAQYYGAAHQKPQRFQVVTLKNRPPIRCGRIYIEFIANKKAGEMPTKKFNTYAGVIEVATPEQIANDIVSMPRHAAGISNVATVLMELAEKINITKIIELTQINPELFWLQRLGYLLEFLEFDQLANEITKILTDKKLHWVRLVSHASYKPLLRDKKWKIIVNTKVEPDE